jgi:hypothetical protein
MSLSFSPVTRTSGVQTQYDHPRRAILRVSFSAAWIKQLAAEGITGGCGGNYCPSTSVTRDQMAVFLVRTFQLPLP